MNYAIRAQSILLTLLTAITGLAWADDPSGTVEQAILGEADRYAVAWNQGDTAAIYGTHHASYVLVTADGPITLKARMSAVEQRLDSSEDRGVLSFHDMTIKSLGDDYALAYGRASLLLKDGTQTSVWFTSVYMRTEAGWKAIHDHG